MPGKLFFRRAGAFGGIQELTAVFAFYGGVPDFFSAVGAAFHFQLSLLQIFPIFKLQPLQEIAQHLVLAGPVVFMIRFPEKCTDFVLTQAEISPF